MYAGGGANVSGAATDHHGGGHGHHSSAAFSSAAAEANDLDALVFEYGTSRCKLGYAGEDFPRIFESPLPVESDPSGGDGMAEGEDEGAVLRAAQMERDPERLAQWLFDASSARLQTRLSDHPLLFVERPFVLPDEVTSAGAGGNGADQATAASGGASTASGSTTSTKKRDSRAREKLVEVFMEELGVPALFCAKSAVLTCYANARTSGLVVEMGATYTSVTSVHEGYAFAYPKSQVALFGGHDLDGFLRGKLASQVAKSRSEQQDQVVQGVATVPEEEIARRRTKRWWSYAIEAKESGLCRVADGPFDEAQNTQLPLITYELPDKTVISMGTERFSVAEHYFLSTPSTDNSAIASGGSVATSGVGMRLPELICETGGLTTETELRKELFQNIVLTGGSSSFENMPTRIEREVVAALSGSQLPLTASGAMGGLTSGLASSLRVKVVAAHPQERRVGSFLGGSILASLGSFHEMWMSKAEYAEHGAALIHKKCP